MKHKHYECIVAWAEGKKIQVRYEKHDWEDLTTSYPGWYPHQEYRIKPEPQKEQEQEPIGNTKQLAVAWIEHHKGGDNLNWEEVNHSYAKATPLYTHPMRELTRKDFLEIWENEVNKFHDVEEYDIANFARAIIKTSRGEK